MTPEKRQNDEMFIFGIGVHRRRGNLSLHKYVEQL
jgi:hypothetical protein